MKKITPLYSPGFYSTIENQDDGYLGMAVQFYVQALLGHYHIFPRRNIAKTDGIDEIYTPFFFTFTCII